MLCFRNCLCYFMPTDSSFLDLEERKVIHHPHTDTSTTTLVDQVSQHLDKAANQVIQCLLIDKVIHVSASKLNQVIDSLGLTDFYG